MGAMWLSASLTLSLAVTFAGMPLGSSDHSLRASDADAKEAVKQLKALKQYVGDNLLTDPGIMARIATANIWAASLDDIIPKYSAFPFMLSPKEDTKYKFSICSRAKIAECMTRGNSSNGLPKSLQGIWWQDGDHLDEEAVSTAGEWEPETKTLSIPLWEPGTWAAHATSSVRAESLWLPSGAAFLTWLGSWRPHLKARFNEDLSHTKITIGGIMLYIFPFQIAQFVWGNELTRMADGSWARETSFLGLPLASGTYVLRPIVDGKGKPAKFFDEWAALYGGRSIATLVQA